MISPSGLVPCMARDPGRPDAVAPAAPAYWREADLCRWLSPASVLSWLELLHPAGTTASGLRAPTPVAGVPMLAPRPGDQRGHGWLARDLDRMAEELSPDGLGYVAVERRWRPRAVRLATRRGLQVGPWIAHLPPLPSTLYLIPIESRTLRYAFGALVPGHRWTRRLLPAALAAGAAPLLPWLLPSAGFVVRKPGARPLLEWLLNLPGPSGGGNGTDRRGTALISAGWRDTGRSAVLQRFRAEESRPDIAVKVAPIDCAAAHRGEATRLETLGPDAGRAGAVVPRALALTSLGARSVLSLSAVPGRPVATLLAARPSRLPGVVEVLTRWLGRWHAITRVEGATSADALASLVLEGLDPIAAHVPRAEAYRRWLARRCEALSTRSIPAVAAHNDLTMWNVLMDADGALGVVDWQHAIAASPPLVDFFYAMADAVLAAGQHPTRLAALAACVGPHGDLAQLTTRLWTGLAADLGLAADVPTLVLHACWIRHGANAHAEPPGTAGARIFIDIVRWLAERRVELAPTGA